MAAPRSRIRLEADTRARLVKVIQDHARAEWDEPLSAFKAGTFLDVLVRELGPAVYNQGVRDAAVYMQARLLDLEEEVHERESGA
jgi:uncharacterized protein (DUF2164 family)